MMAAEKVKDRACRAAAAFANAGVPYAIVGGNAVAEWVGRVDEAAIRNTADVDIMIRRSDLAAAKSAMAAAGFVHGEVMGVDMFLDGPDGRPRDAVHIVFASEKVRPDDLSANPDVAESEPGLLYQVVALEALVLMKLTSYRRKDQVHLGDMIEVGLIDSSWPARFPPELAARLQHILDTPGG